MDNKKLNTVIEFEFYDGTKAKMTLTFYALYQLKAKNKSLYERYNSVMAKAKNMDELDMVTVLYTAYVCANMLSKEPVPDDALMGEEDFMIACGSDRVAVGNAVRDLTQPKKQ